MTTINSIFLGRPGVFSTRAAVLAVVAAFGPCAVNAATLYFDPTDTTTLGGSGTFAAQTTALYSSTSAGGGTLVAAAATDTGIFQGTAGTITFSVTPYALASATFNTTNYVLTDTKTVVFNAPVTLAANVNLNLNTAASTTDFTLGVASVTGGSGSTLTIQGAETGTASARVNIAAAGSTISVPTTISGAGTSLAGYVATTTGDVIANTINNSTGFTTLLGATSGFDLTLGSAAVVSGSSGVQFSAGSSGGAGLVTVSSANTYTGATTLNNSTTGVVRLGVDNALPTATALQFGVAANNTGSLDLNGHNQTVASLAVITTGTVNGIVNTSANPAALTINGSATTIYNSIIGVPANAGTATLLAGANNNISLTLASTNTGSLTLSGINPYTGATKIGGGTLVLATGGSINGSPSVQITGTGALTLNNAAALSDAGTLSLTSGATLNLNAASGTSETIAALILDGTFEPAGTYTAAQLSTFDTTGGVSNITFSSASGETLTIAAVPEPRTVLGGVLMMMALGWLKRRQVVGQVTAWRSLYAAR